MRIEINPNSKLYMFTNLKLHAQSINKINSILYDTQYGATNSAPYCR